jgi:hypothetical protein
MYQKHSSECAVDRRNDAQRATDILCDSALQTCLKGKRTNRKGTTDSHGFAMIGTIKRRRAQRYTQRQETIGSRGLRETTRNVLSAMRALLSRFSFLELDTEAKMRGEYFLCLFLCYLYRLYRFSKYNISNRNKTRSYNKE